MEKHFINVKYTDKQLKEFKNAWLSKYDRKEPEHGLLNPGLAPSSEVQNLKKALFTEGPHTPFPFLPPKILDNDREEEERRRRQDHYNSIKRKMDALNTLRTAWVFARPYVTPVAAEQVDGLIRVAYRIIQTQARERMAPQIMAQVDVLEETARRQLEVESVLRLNISGQDKEYTEAAAMFRNKYGVTTNIWNYNENLKQQIAIQTGSIAKGSSSTPALVSVNYDLNKDLEEYYQKRVELYYKPVQGHSNIVPNLIANSDTSINNRESVTEKKALSNHLEVDTESKTIGRVVIDNNANEINKRHAAINLEKEYILPTTVTTSLLPPENAIHKQEMDVAQNDEYFPPKDKNPLDANSKYPFDIAEPQKGYPNVGELTRLENVETIPYAVEPVARETGDPQIDAQLQISRGDNTISSRQIRPDNSQSIFPGFITNFFNFKTNSKDLVTEITKLPPNGKTHNYDLSFMDLIDGHKYAIDEREENEMWKQHDKFRKQQMMGFLNAPGKLYELTKYVIGKIYNSIPQSTVDANERNAPKSKASKKNGGPKQEEDEILTEPYEERPSTKEIKPFEKSKKTGEVEEVKTGIMNKMSLQEVLFIATQIYDDEMLNQISRLFNKRGNQGAIEGPIEQGAIENYSPSNSVGKFRGHVFGHEKRKDAPHGIRWLLGLLDQIPGDIMGPDMDDLINMKNYLGNMLTTVTPNNEEIVKEVVNKHEENEKVIPDIETLAIDNTIVDNQLTDSMQPVTESPVKSPMAWIDITKYFPFFKEATSEKILDVIPEVRAELEKEEKLPDLNPAYNNIIVHNAVLEKQVKQTPSSAAPQVEIDFTRSSPNTNPWDHWSEKDREIFANKKEPGFFDTLSDWWSSTKIVSEKEAAYAAQEAQLKREALNRAEWWKPIIEEEYNINSEHDDLPYTKQDLYTLAELVINNPKIYISRKYDAFNYVRNDWKDKVAGIDDNMLNRIIGDEFAERPSDSHQSLMTSLKQLWAYGGSPAAAASGYKFSKYLARFFYRTNLQSNWPSTMKGYGVEGICKCGSRKNLLVHDKKPEDYTCEKCYHMAGRLTNSRYTDKTANIIALSASKHPQHRQAFQSNLELENYQRLANSNIPTAYDTFFDNPVDSKFINRINSGLLIGRGVRDCDHKYIAHAMGVNAHAPDTLNHYGKQNLSMMITKLLHAHQHKPKRAINMHNLAKVSTLEKELRENPKVLEHYTV